MKFFRLDLLTLLISLFILNSCKNQDSIGLGVNTGSQVNGTLIDTSTIFAQTVKDDSVVTDNGAKNPVGFFKDPIFGTVTSDLVTDLNLPGGGGYSLPSGTISIDSTRLVMRYADGFYGDSVASTYKLNVYQLKNKYDKTISHYDVLTYQHESALLGSVTFSARTHDSIKISNIITGKPDTLIKVPPQLRVPFDNNFILTNFFNANSTILGSNAQFQNSIKGLYITLDKNQTTGAGGVIMFRTGDTLTVYCKIKNGTSIDTTQIKLPISNLAVSVNRTFSTTIQAELNNTSTSGNLLYLQGLSGLRTKISFPNLLVNLRNDLAKRDSDIILNRAEIVITPNPGSNIPYQPLPKLTMYKLDLARQRTNVQDANTSAVDPRSLGAAVFGGYYSPARKQYHFVVTSYLQDLLLKKTVDYGTYIAPVDTASTTVNIAPTTQVAARTVAVGTDKTSPYRIRLNIIYTKIAK